MMETFPKKASCMLLGVSPCTWRLGEGGCIYLTPGKKSLRFGCRATGKNFERGGHKESHRQKPPTSKQPRVVRLAAALMFPQHKALLSLLSCREAGGGSGSPASAAASADLFVHSPVIRDRPEQSPGSEDF